MSRVLVQGIGAISPAGWGVAPMREALANGTALTAKPMVRPGWKDGLLMRQVPPPQIRPEFLTHPRLRRTSPISQYVVASALEAIGGDAPLIASGSIRLGVILCAMSGCVNFSRRFYDETLRDPATASPLIFPETVFNAPASHLATVLRAPSLNYTLVGDPGTFVQGLALAAHWLGAGRVDACVVIGAEECDWLVSDAFRLFSRGTILGDGAGALYLKRDGTATALAELDSVTDSHLFSRGDGRRQAARNVRKQLPPCPAGELLVDGRQNLAGLDRAEAEAWADWSGARLSPKTVLGEGLMAGAAWQCAAAVDALNANGYAGANVSVVGCNQQAIGARFMRMEKEK